MGENPAQSWIARTGCRAPGRAFDNFPPYLPKQPEELTLSRSVRVLPGFSTKSPYLGPPSSVLLDQSKACLRGKISFRPLFTNFSTSFDNFSTTVIVTVIPFRSSQSATFGCFLSKKISPGCLCSDKLQVCVLGCCRRLMCLI